MDRETNPEKQKQIELKLSGKISRGDGILQNVREREREKALNQMYI